MHDDRPEQRFVFSQRNHYPRADPARVYKLSIGVVCAVDLLLGGVGDPDDILAARDAGQRPSGEQVRGAFPPHRFNELRVSAQCYGMSLMALDPPNVPVSGLAQADRPCQHRIEDRREVAGRGIDNLQDLGHRGLSRQRFIALGCPGVELPPKLGYGLREIELRVVGHRLRLPSTITRDDTLPAPAPPAMSAREIGRRLPTRSILYRREPYFAIIITIKSPHSSAMRG